MLAAGLLEIRGAVEKILGRGLYLIDVPEPDLTGQPDWGGSYSLPITVSCST